MDNSRVLARAVLDVLVDDDLIEVEAHDEAVEALGAAIDKAGSDDMVGVITEFLDEEDVIDEIYGSDAELRSAIERVLSTRAA
jgi:hypothetical protein